MTKECSVTSVHLTQSALPLASFILDTLPGEFGERDQDKLVTVDRVPEANPLVVFR
ncbi:MULTISPECIES: hypothetical protein [unclassified Rhizobium]|uniref:hypothetical protein n=1 Tax=unclassified Rhizobium TaxID=2613769 RepID=UPI00167B9187|nr:MULTISPECIES: hypothetical protein [unclassified Rhizobium]